MGKVLMNCRHYYFQRQVFPATGIFSNRNVQLNNLVRGKDMAYDENVAQRVRKFLDGIPGVTEKKMFGGIAFMVNGNMCGGVVDRELMMRVGAEGYKEALSQPHARPMDFTGKPMKGFVYVAAKGFETDDGLKSWIDRSLQYVGNLPAK